MKFQKHDDPNMGLYWGDIDDPIQGKRETLFVFNLAENPELAEQYLVWLSENQ